ncbi:MAG TPA: hypothetical protein VFC72_00310 [Corynebacterium sp.]|nr:hypothetical protein [Corynebacterium sp.]
MHYTSWERGDRDRPILLAEDGPRELAVFDTRAEQALVDGHIWELSVTPDQGATATLADGRVFRAEGRFRRDKEITVSLDGRSFTLLNENKNDWIIEDGDQSKIAQFTGADQAVRRAIVEFVGEAEDHALSPEEIIALAWFSRLALESRMEQTSNALIFTLVILSVVGVLAFLL